MEYIHRDLAHGSNNRGGARPGSGRPRGVVTKVKRDLRDWARKSGKEAFENLRKLALHGENEFVRLAATKEWLDRGFGKPVAADGEASSGPVQVNVVTGVREGGAFVPYDKIPMPPAPYRPQLPDGRDPFERRETGVLPSGRPIRNAPVAEPPSTVTLTEGGRDTVSRERPGE